jgi:hypothetical protein
MGVPSNPFLLLRLQRRYQGITIVIVISGFYAAIFFLLIHVLRSSSCGEPLSAWGPTDITLPLALIVGSHQKSNLAVSHAAMVRNGQWRYRLRFPFYYIGDSLSFPGVPCLDRDPYFENLSYGSLFENSRETAKNQLSTLSYFVHNISTDIRWLLRTDDDVVLNFRALGEFIEEVDGRYDAIHKRVMAAGPVDGHPQGGAYLFSRALAEKLLGGQLLLAFQDGFHVDDWAMGQVVLLSEVGWVSARFDGRATDETAVWMVKLGNFSACENGFREVVGQGGMGPIMLRDIVSFHAVKDPRLMEMTSWMLSEAPSGIWAVPARGRSRMFRYCKEDGQAPDTAGQPSVFEK